MNHLELQNLAKGLDIDLLTQISFGNSRCSDISALCRVILKDTYTCATDRTCVVRFKACCQRTLP